MRDLNELGIRPPVKTGLLRPPTSAEIQAFEDHFGVRLPGDYLAFLQGQNGGIPTACWFTSESGYRSCIGSFHYLLPEDPQRLDLLHDPNGWEFGNVWAETRELRKTIRAVMERLAAVRDISTEQVIPFAADNGNASIFAFDVRKNPPSVCMIVVEDGFRIVPLTDSFSSLIDLLQEDEGERRRSRTRPRTIRLVAQNLPAEFPYEAAAALIRCLPGVTVSPAKIDVPTPSGDVLLPDGRQLRLPPDFARSLREKAASGKCLDFSWEGPPRMSGALSEDELFIRVLDDWDATLHVTKMWGEKLDLTVVAR